MKNYNFSLTTALLSFFYSFLLNGQICSTPGNIKIIASGCNSITLDWDSLQTGHSHLQLRYTVQGGNLNQAAMHNINVKPFRVSGLTANTSYWIQLHDSCSIGGVGSFSDTIYFKTACVPLNVPFTETFDGPTWTPVSVSGNMGIINSCWLRDLPNYSMYWRPNTGHISGPSGSSHDHTSGSGSFMEIHISAFPHRNDSAWLETPLIDLGTLSNPALSFWYHKYGDGIGDLIVELTNDFGISYLELGRITGETQDSLDDHWLDKIFDLSSYANDTVRIRFLAVQKLLTVNNRVS